VEQELEPSSLNVPTEGMISLLPCEYSLLLESRTVQNRYR